MAFGKKQVMKNDYWERCSAWWLGSRDKPFEYTHHALLLAGGSLHLVAAVFNLALETAEANYAISMLLLVPLYLFFWYQSRWCGRFQIMAVAFNFLFVLFNLPLNWFFNGGSAGPTLMFYLIGLVYITVVLRSLGRVQRALQLLFLLVPVLLLLVEQQYPTWVYPYPNEQVRQWDLVFSYFVTAVCVLILVNNYGRRYQLERDRATALAEQLRLLAERDTLTGLFNRRAIEQSYQAWQGQPFCVALMDLDHFKRLNDTFGHAYGDEVLKRFAELAQKVATPLQAVAGRHGGEEFVLLVPGDLAVAEQCLIQLRQQLYAIDLLHGVVTFSGGIVSVQEGESLDHALHRADLLLYAAKEQGRDRVFMETLSPHTAPRQEESEASMV